MTATPLPEALIGLTPEPVWRHFAELAARPRGSGQEALVREYVLGWAKAGGFEAQADAVGNVVVRVPGRGRGVDSPPVMIQGHLDMVCEKNAATVHDFETDPIRLLEVDGRICADGTTLGADNGIGVALGMAAADGLFSDHPPLELLMTIDEETGMTGARELDPSLLVADRMINLDAEEEGTLYVGCAGGQDTVVTGRGAREEAPADNVTVAIHLEGLKGGHSGLDIHKNRGNAIRLLAQALLELEVPYRLVRLEGGSKRNAIAREARAVVSLGAQHAEALTEDLKTLQDRLLALHADSEERLILRAEAVSDKAGPLDAAFTHALLCFLFSVPHGVATMSQAVDGLVETSNNLGVMAMTDDDAGTTSVQITLCSRSSNMPALAQIADQIATIAGLSGFGWRREGGYPGWQPQMDSPILAQSRAVFRALLDGQEPEVTAIHAGLECGLLGAKFPGLDMIAFGPDITGAHSPDESVSIASVGVVAKQLGALLAALC